MKKIKIYYSRKRAVAVLLAIPLLLGLMLWVFYHFNANRWSFVAPLFIALACYGSICYRIYQQRVCMIITDEYLEVNSKSKWRVCFRDVEEFYRADYDLIGIRYKKTHENWRPDAEIEEDRKERLNNVDAPGAVYEIPTRTMDIKPQKLLDLLNQKLYKQKYK